MRDEGKTFNKENGLRRKSPLDLDTRNPLDSDSGCGFVKYSDTELFISGGLGHNRKVTTHNATHMGTLKQSASQGVLKEEVKDESDPHLLMFN